MAAILANKGSSDGGGFGLPILASFALLFSLYLCLPNYCLTGPQVPPAVEVGIVYIYYNLYYTRKAYRPNVFHCLHDLVFAYNTHLTGR